MRVLLWWARTSPRSGSPPSSWRDLVRNAGWLVLAALVFGLVNLVVRPLVILLAFPAVILTLGLALLLVNALMLLLTSAIVPGIDVDDFFWAAVLGALIVWLVNMLLHAVLPERRGGWRRHFGA